MHSSLKLRLLVWYTLTLGCVLFVFVLTMLADTRASRLEQLDAELSTHAHVLARSIDVQPDGSVEIDLADEYLRYFQDVSRTGADPAYYAAWRPNGELIVRSDPNHVPPFPLRPLTRTRAGEREIVVAGPQGVLVLVGRGTSALQQRLRDLARMAVGASATALVFALLGGWFLTTRALAPIDRISKTAAAISESNLSQRIDVAQTESELGRLARTLNATFDRLEAAFDRQTRFTADASHELRTPLAIVVSQAELALRRERSAASYRETIETILRAARRMHAVVEGLLTLARADAGELKLNRGAVDLRRIVEDTAELLADAAAARRLTIELALEELTVSGDPDRLREVVLNLLSNAMRYNHEGGRVSVRLHGDTGKAVTLEVADTGIGIAPADQAHIFDRFYRVDKARARAAGGSGLGLAITRWIVEAHGGTISFTSQPGSGTTFRVTLCAAGGA